MNKSYHYCDGSYEMVDENGKEYLLSIQHDAFADSPREWDNVSTMVCWHRRYNLGDKHNYKNAEEFLRCMLLEIVSGNPRSQIVYDFLKNYKAENAYIEHDEDEDGGVGEWCLYTRYGKDSDWYLSSSYPDSLTGIDIPDWFLDDCLEELSDGELMELLDATNEIVIIPINMYDHSGITISTSSEYPYNDRWDSGFIGFAYITKEKAMKDLLEYVLGENGERIKIEHKHEGMQSTWSYKTEPLNDETWKKRAKEAIDAEVETYDYFLRGETYGYTLEEKIHVRNEKTCPHCGEVISVEEYDDYEEIDSCYGFYGCCIEENGIMDCIGSLKFVD